MLEVYLIFNISVWMVSLFLTCHFPIIIIWKDPLFLSCLVDKHMMVACLTEKNVSFIFYPLWWYLERDPRPKFYPYFFGIFLLTLWRKNLLKSFLAYFTKLWSYKVLNSMLSQLMYITFYTCIFVYFCYFYWKRTFYKVLWYSG